jgi:uncharacterized protein (TIGR03435 family)
MFRTATAAAAFCAIALAQTPASPTFDVATVKAAAPQQPGQMMMRQRGGPGSQDPGQYSVENFSLSRLLMRAYGVQSYQITGPSWLESERFDVVAKIPAGTTEEQFRLMLQNLLAERFKLAIHQETKELPTYALVVAKGGPKLKESAKEDPNAPAAAPPQGPPPVGRDGRMQMPRGGRGMMVMMGPKGLHTEAARSTMAQLSDFLSNQLGRPVLDMTGLTGQYDYSLDFSPEGLAMMKGPGMMAPPPGGGGHAEEGGPEGGGSLFSAVQDLGLKLESRKGPVALVVVDSGQKTPTEN